MALYTALNLVILLPALVLSFDKKVAYWRSWLQALAAILVVGGIFIAWDALVTKVGHWDFSSRYAGSGRFLGLPLGEYLFFLSVPFACLFLLQVARTYFPEREGRLSPIPFLGLAVLALGLAWLFRAKGYSLLVFTSLALTLGVLAFPARKLFSRRSTWIALGLSYLAFLVFNGIFTGLPIVTYNPVTILGLRVFSIPIEDFFYNFSLITLTYWVFDLFSGLRISRKKP